MTYSDWAEDVWLLGQYPKGYQGWACEVGAFDGQTHSQTLLLEEHGWTCLCIEPNPNMVKKLRKRRPFVLAYACGSESQDDADFFIHEDNQEAHSALKPVVDHPIWHPKEGARFFKVPVSVRTLDSCLAEARFTRLDVLCIDTEGHELEVLRGTDLTRWDPKFIVAESWDKDTPITPYLMERGYHRVRRSGVNNIYKRKDSHGADDY